MPEEIKKTLTQDITRKILQAPFYGDHNQVILVLKSKFLEVISTKMDFIHLCHKWDGMKEECKQITTRAQFKMTQRLTNLTPKTKHQF